MVGKCYILFVLWLLVGVVGCAQEESTTNEVVIEGTSRPKATFALSSARSTVTKVVTRVVSPTPRATSTVLPTPRATSTTPTRTPRPTSVQPTRMPRATSMVPTHTPRPVSVVPTHTLVPTEVTYSAEVLAAQEAVRIGEWERAYGLYEALLADDANADEREAVLFYLGDLYWRDNETELAVQTWQIALDEAPDGRFGPYIRYRLAREMAEEGLHEQAVEWLEQVDEENDEADGIVIQRLIESYQALDEIEKVMVLHERLYDLSTTSEDMKAFSANALANLYKNNKQAQEALQWYEHALEATQPKYHAPLLVMMAEMAMELDDRAYARQLWHRVVDEYPSRWGALSAATQLAEEGHALSEEQLGELYLANQRWDEAQDAFLTVLEEENHDASIHQKRAYALEGQERLSGALEEWLKLTTTHPEAEDLHDDALLEMARLHLLLGNEREAQVLWQQIAQEHGDGDAAPRALLAYAEWLRQQGATAQKIASAFNEAATSYPAHEQASDALWQAGQLWFKMGDVSQAQKAFEQLAEYEEYAAEGWFWAGKSATQQGNKRVAQRAWKQAIATNESYYEALRAIELAENMVFDARIVQSIKRSDVDSELLWLQDATDLPDEVNLYEVPDEALLTQGKALLLMGEQEAAMESFRTVIRAYREDAQALWAIAQDLHTHHVDRYSIFAAHLLMDLLDYTPLTAPPALAQLAYPIPFEAQLYEAATKWQHDPLLFAALVFQESRWDPRAHSYAGARGLTQIIPTTADWLAERLEDEQYSYHQLDRPLIALEYSGYYFDYLLKRFEQNPYHALAAYHSGPGNAQKWLNEDPDLFIEEITIGQTRTYVKAVYEHWHAYQHIYGK